MNGGTMLQGSILWPKVSNNLVFNAVFNNRKETDTFCKLKGNKDIFFLDAKLQTNVT